MSERFLPTDIVSIGRQLEEAGYAILTGVLEQSVIDAAKRDLAGIVDQLVREQYEKGKITDLLESEPFETRMIKAFENDLDNVPKSFRRNLHVPGLFGVFFHSGLLDVVEALLGPEIRLYPNYTARPKLPEWKGTEVLWHQDGGYTAPGSSEDAVRSMHMLNVWTPLVPANVENGCMQFVPESHRHGVVPHVRKKHYLEIAPEYLDPVREKAISIEMEPGEVVLFDNLLFHCGLPNRAKTIRWSIDWRYQNASEPTNRKEVGHLARSQTMSDQVVTSADSWAKLHFK